MLGCKGLIYWIKYYTTHTMLQYILISFLIFHAQLTFSFSRAVIPSYSPEGVFGADWWREEWFWLERNIWIKESNKCLVWVSLPLILIKRKNIKKYYLLLSSHLEKSKKNLSSTKRKKPKISGFFQIQRSKIQVFILLHPTAALKMYHLC